MELTIFLSKVIGLYMLIAGIGVLVNRRHIMLAVVGIVQERAAQLIGGVMALFIGLVIVNLHNDWSTTPAALVSLIGWIGIAKGLVYFFLPEAKLVKLMKALTDRSWYVFDGLVAAALGLYLAGFGYGWF